MWNQLRCACPTAVVPKSGKGQMIPSSKVGQSCTDRLHGSLGSLSLRLDWTPIAQYQPFEWKRMLKDRLICQRGPTRRSPVALNFPLLAVSALCGAEPWAATRTKRSARLPSSAKHVGIERPTVGEVGCTAFVNPFFWVFWRMSLGFCRSFSLAQVGSRGAPDQSGIFASAASCFPSSQGGALGQPRPVGRMERPEKDNFWDLHRRLAECYMSELAVSGIPCCTGLVFFHVIHVAMGQAWRPMNSWWFGVIIWDYFGTWFILILKESCHVPWIATLGGTSYVMTSGSLMGHILQLWLHRPSSCCLANMARLGMVPGSELTSGWLPSLRTIFVVKNVGKNAETWKSYENPI